MSDLLAQLDVLRHGPIAVVDRSDRGHVRVTGPDALSFLQALVSADLDALSDGEGAESLLLHPQGKLDVAFRLLRVGGEAWLDTDPGLAPQLVASLDRFKIRVEAQVVDVTDELAMFSEVGTDPAEAPVALHSHVAPSDLGGTRVVRTRLGVDVMGPPAAVRARRDARLAAGAVLVDADAWEAFRIEQGIPVQPVDIDDSTIPQEAELELDAVSFTKGCFIGQELVCRIDSRGHVNRFLRRLTAIDGPRPASGTEIVVDGKVVGTVTSVSPEPFPPVALGYVRREVDPPETVELQSPSGNGHARVEPLHPDA
ncbi:MAG: YgfZ/GcvT domain-containing protein [Acidimicrobiia bacterium]